MSNANRDYAVVYDVKNSLLALSRPLIFYITDKNTSNIFVRLVTRVSVGNGIDQYTNIENASNYVLTMRVIKPSNEVKSLEATQHEEGSIFQFDLAEDFKDMPGKYICELTISTIVNSRQELITSDSFNYEVKRSILSNVSEIIETEDTTVEKLLNDLDATKAEISSRINTERKRIDNLATLQEGSTTGDAELIDGRIGADGVTYNNIGNSIRKQIKKINANILDFKNGLETFYSYANFDNGTLDYGEFKKYNLKRIASNDIITFDRDIEIHVEAGYKLTICLFQNGVYATDLAYVTDSYRLPKGTSVRIMIGLVDETDAIDNPDILEFLSKVTFKTIVENRIHSVEYENSYNKTLIHNASKDIYTLGHYCNMELGTVDAGVVSYRKNRITSNDIVHFDYDVKLKIADGYRFGMSVMNSDGTYKEWSGWQTSNYTIKANTYFKPLIAKVTEDDNKVDLIEMNNMVTISKPVLQSESQDYKDTLEFVPGGFGYPGTGGIWTGDLPTNRFITKDIQVAPYDLVVGFNEPSTNYSYQIAFYPSTSTNEATNAEILFKEYCYEKTIIPKGTPYRLNYILKDGTVNDIYNHGYKNLIVEKYDKNISAPVYNTLLPSSPKIAMHKGYSGRAPENSAAAFRLAGQQSKVYAIECDIQVTSDGKFVIFHEQDLSSRTNGSGAVGDKTFDEVIACVYDKVANGLDQYPNEHVCSLEEYLKICKKYGKIALCEFKFKDKDRNNIDNFKNFVKLLYKTGMQHSTIVISFTSSELAKLHYIDNSIYVLHVLMSYDNFDYRLSGLIDNYGIDVNYENSSAGNGLTEQQIEDAHSKGLTVGVWTVDDSSIKDKFIDLGVDLITTNRIE